jgi:catechol 2,3-dioxygenase-like lactoylglutathione lyase family enzyme
MAVTRLLRVSITVSDLEQTAAFCRDGLGLKAGPETEVGPGWLRLLGLGETSRARSVDVAVGEQVVEVVAFDPPGAPYPAEPLSNDQSFEHVALVTRDIAAAFGRLRTGKAGVITTGGPVTLPPNTGRVAAFKFRDPEGHPLELIEFPAGVGVPAWQGATGAGIIGYDHTAIAVADPERSLSFYVDLLGFRISGRTLNRGPEQDRLDGLNGCVVDVVALEPAAVATPHVELLHYRTPRGRRSTVPIGAADASSVRQVHQVDDLDGLVARLRTEAVTFVSKGREALNGGRGAIAVRDPDGHMLVLIE